MTISGNALVMKEININLVRRALKARKQATKQEIARETGLSTVTVNTVLQKLTETHEVYEIGLVASSGGRPAQQFGFNENHAHVLGLFTHEEQGKDIAHVRVANLFGECVYEQDVELNEITLYSFEGLIDRAIEAYPTIGAIGLGLPGVAINGQMILCDYTGLVGAPLSDYYQGRTGRPVLVENDVNAAVMGYCKQQNIETEAAVVYLYFPKKYPPGAGIYVNGRVYRGHSNFAGEVTSLPIGIDWHDPALYDTPARLHDAIARLLASIGALLNPHTVVIYGSFLTAASLEDIRQNSAHWLPTISIPQLHYAPSFTLDYQNGLIHETLAVLEPHLSIVL